MVKEIDFLTDTHCSISNISLFRYKCKLKVINLVLLYHDFNFEVNADNITKCRLNHFSDLSQWQICKNVCMHVNSRLDCIHALF